MRSRDDEGSSDHEAPPLSLAQSADQEVDPDSDSVSDSDMDVTEEALISDADDADTLGKHKELYTLLLRDFGQISKAEKRHYDSLAVVNVSPSVVPNPYLPSFRIFVYNATGAAYVPGDIGHGQGVGGRAGTSIDLGTCY